MREALHPRDDDTLYVSRKKAEEDLPVLRTALIQRLEGYIKKREDLLQPPESILTTQEPIER